MSKWINIKDALPPNNDSVLIILKCCNESIISASFCCDRKYFFSNVSGHEYPDADWWMPIPELPEVE